MGTRLRQPDFARPQGCPGRSAWRESEENLYRTMMPDYDRLLERQREKEEKTAAGIHAHAHAYAKLGEFGMAARALRRAFREGRGEGVAAIAGEKNDWFSVATLLYFKAAGGDYDMERYVEAYRMAERLNAAQARGFELEVVKRRQDFAEWDAEDAKRRKRNTPI